MLASHIHACKHVKCTCIQRPGGFLCFCGVAFEEFLSSLTAEHVFHKSFDKLSVTTQNAVNDMTLTFGKFGYSCCPCINTCGHVRQYSLSVVTILVYDTNFHGIAE